MEQHQTDQGLDQDTFNLFNGNCKYQKQYCEFTNELSLKNQDIHSGNLRENV